MAELDWAYRAESFARIRAQIIQVLVIGGEMDVAEIAYSFKQRFRYLPEIERRLRELKESGKIIKIGGSIPKYKLLE